jgi:NDP-sugar pyrophosphorylase family protein/aminoglycoside/choline kinase family phosphotransferase
LTGHIPKPLLPVWGRPVIGHTLNRLHEAGVTDVLVNLHHAPQPLWDYLRSQPVPGLRIQCSFEPAILGTGGALRHAAWFVDDTPFWMVNGDILFEADLAPLLKTFIRRPIAALWMTRWAGPRTVELKHNRVVSFRSSSPGTPNAATFTGLHLVSPDILGFLPDQDFSTIIDAYAAAMKCGQHVAGIELPHSYWTDIGTPDAYRQAHADTWMACRKGRPGGRCVPAGTQRTIRALRKTGVVVRGFAALSAGVRIARGAILEDSVVMDGVTIGPNAVLSRALVAPGLTLDAQRLEGMAVHLADLEDANIEEAAGLIGMNALQTQAFLFPARASGRRFIRLVCGSRRAIVIQYTDERPDNTQFTSSARFLRRVGLPVPAILLDQPERRLILVEDLGDTNLLDRLAQTKKQDVQSLYRPVLDLVVALHHPRVLRAARRAGLPVNPPFSPALYEWERELFLEHFIIRRMGLTASEASGVMAELSVLGDGLSGAGTALLHRDLQSTNIQWHRGRPVLIDFQSMRVGPPLYDVASLLCDPYASMDADVQTQLLAYYIRQTDEAVGDYFWPCAVQRLVQALGAYGRISAQPATSDFSRHIIPGLIMLDRALQYVDNLGGLGVLVRRALDREQARSLKRGR